MRFWQALDPELDLLSLKSLNMLPFVTKQSQELCIYQAIQLTL